MCQNKMCEEIKMPKKCSRQVLVKCLRVSTLENKSVNTIMCLSGLVNNKNQFVCHV